MPYAPTSILGLFAAAAATTTTTRPPSLSCKLFGPNLFGALIRSFLSRPTGRLEAKPLPAGSVPPGGSGWVREGSDVVSFRICYC